MVVTAVAILDDCTIMRYYVVEPPCRYVGRDMEAAARQPQPFSAVQS